MTTKSRAKDVTTEPKTRWMYIVEYYGEARVSDLYRKREDAEAAMAGEVDQYGPEEIERGNVEFALYEVASAFNATPTVVEIKFDYEKF
jgi:hypothetical protein